ncbi:MAG: SUMF1/EgtB/PvdO family nonheme iron enzyme, partial [Deltaproteobacteria bacterium]|nr:SUMF1/EgtB/PvdO family nonheme iron enzyme [Deltaproteobacteria bacterium]
NALKYRLINVIRGFYEDENSIESLKGIDPDKLIKLLWDTGNDPAIIKNRRKNLSSVKSSVNADLKKLYREGKNPDGVSIGPAYVFVMSDEARDKALKAFIDSGQTDGPVNLGEITQALNLVDQMLSKPAALSGRDGSEGSGKLDELKDLIHGLSEKVGAGGPGLAESGPEASQAALVEEDVEEIEEPAEDEVIEDLEDTEIDEVIEDLEDTEIDEVIESEGVEEEIDSIETDDDLEEVEVDEALQDAEIDDDQELSEIEEPAEDEVMEGIEDVLAEDEYEGFDEMRKARLLAEEFNDSLAAMDKFYNQYILVPGGEYIVGNKQPKKDERPEQIVALSPFYMGKFPVTNALFEIFVEKTGYRTTAEKLGFGTVYYGRCQKTVDERTGMEKCVWNSALINKTVEGACWYQPLGPGSTLNNKKKCPVVQVSIEDAMAFAAWTGKRLPTENEWEAASRTANGYIFPWGNEWQKDTCNTEESYTGETTPVDKYMEYENDSGIVDTLGNVLEWTMDRSGLPYSEKNGPVLNIVKGGSWISENNVPLSTCFKLEPESHSNILGFRCVAY